MAPRKPAVKTTKVKDEPLRDYELTLIINPELDDEQVNLTLEKVNQFITERGGEVAEPQPWGKKKMAYPIKQSLEGNYILNPVKLKPTTCKELEASLQIREDILRCLLIRVE